MVGVGDTRGGLIFGDGERHVCAYEWSVFPPPKYEAKHARIFRRDLHNNITSK